MTGPRFDRFACGSCPAQVFYSVSNPDGFPALYSITLDGRRPQRVTHRYLGSGTAIGRDAIYIDQLELRIEPIGKEIAERAASLRARSRGPRLPDAVVLACGEVLEADAILTADRRWRRFGRVLVIG